MKRIISVALALVMVLSCSITAFAIDWTGLTAEEIQLEIDRAKAELLTREIKSIEDNPVIIDADGLVVTITGAEVYKSYDGSISLKFTFTAANNASTAVGFTTDEVYINGWQEFSLLGASLDAGKKTKGEDACHEIDESCDIYSYKDLESVELHMHTFDPNTYRTLTNSIVTTIYFNK